MTESLLHSATSMDNIICHFHGLHFQEYFLINLGNLNLPMSRKFCKRLPNVSIEILEIGDSGQFVIYTQTSCSFSDSNKVKIVKMDYH